MGLSKTMESSKETDNFLSETNNRKVFVFMGLL